MAAWQLLMEESFYYTNPKCFESDLPIFFSRENDQSHKLQRKIEKKLRRDGLERNATSAKMHLRRIFSFKGRLLRNENVSSMNRYIKVS